MATTLFDFDAKANEAPASDAAQPSLLNATLVLAFDGASNESAIFTGTMPQAYAAGTLTALLFTSYASNSGDVDWDVEVEAIADNEATGTSSFDSVNSTDNTTVPATAGLMDVISITLTNKDSVAAGEKVRFRVTRDATSDTNTSDAYLWRVEIREA